MGNKIEHPAGAFCWAELATSDAEAAKKFYTALLGWKHHDDPTPGGGVYTMLRVDGGDVGALFGLTDDMKAAGAPPCWTGYVTVADAAATAAKAKRLGGKVIKDAFDVMDVGCMAVIQDPTGAVFAVWQPKKHHGYDYNDSRVGTACWHELATKDVERAGKFYAELFPWKRTIMDMGPTPYTVFKIGETQAAGMMEMSGESWGDVPPHWMTYFAVADCDASAAKAETLGAKVCVPPTDIPSIGRFSVITDPQGAVFSIIALAPRGK